MIFKPNPDFLKELAKDPAYTEGLKEAAKPASEMAESFARHAMPRKDRSKRIEVVEVDDKVYISNFNHGGHLEEYGSANNPPYAPLRRGASAAGLTLKES